MKSSPPLKRSGKPMKDWPRVLDLDEARKRVEAAEDAVDDKLNPKRIMVDYSCSGDD